MISGIENTVLTLSQISIKALFLKLNRRKKNELSDYKKRRNLVDIYCVVISSLFVSDRSSVWCVLDCYFIHPTNHFIDFSCQFPRLRLHAPFTLQGSEIKNREKFH